MSVINKHIFVIQIKKAYHLLVENNHNENSFIISALDTRITNYTCDSSSLITQVIIICNGIKLIYIVKHKIILVLLMIQISLMLTWMMGVVHLKVQCPVISPMLLLGEVTASDEFKLKFPKLSRAQLKGCRAQLSLSTLIFKLKPSWQKKQFFDLD